MNYKRVLKEIQKIAERVPKRTLITPGINQILEDPDYQALSPEEKAIFALVAGRGYEFEKADTLSE